MTMFIRFATCMALSSAMVACEQVEEPAPQAVGQVIAASTPQKASAPEPTIDDKALRRTFSLTEMKLNDCAKMAPDGVMTGKKCSSGTVLYGPYVAAPKNSDLRLSFDVESEGPLVISSDVVSDMGKTVHGTLEEQGVPANTMRHLSYSVHLARLVESVEARVWIRDDKPTDIKISNFSMQIQ